MKEFIEFLVQNGAYAAYMHNLAYSEGVTTEEGAGEPGEFRSWPVFSRQFGTDDFIFEAFAWDSTTQGFDYWRRLHEAWIWR